MTRWLCTLVVGGILSAFTFLLLTGNYVADGPVVASVTEDHGLHAGDVFVIAGWALAMAALFLLTRHAGRVRTHPEPRAPQPVP